MTDISIQDTLTPEEQAVIDAICDEMVADFKSRQLPGEKTYFMPSVQHGEEPGHRRRWRRVK